MRLKNWWEALPIETREQVHRHSCLLSGILCYPMLCYWYIGLILAILAVVLGYAYAMKQEICREVIIGMVLGSIFLVIVLLFLILGRVYMNFLNIMG